MSLEAEDSATKAGLPLRLRRRTLRVASLVTALALGYCPSLLVKISRRKDGKTAAEPKAELRQAARTHRKTDTVSLGQPTAKSSMYVTGEAKPEKAGRGETENAIREQVPGRAQLACLFERSWLPSC